MTFDPNKTGAQWPKRAKVSLQPVDLGRMTTVQEVCLDSREWNETRSTGGLADL